jgi:hypothetical protein
LADRDRGIDMGEMRRPRKPLEPIATTVGCATTLVLTVLVLSLFVRQARQLAVWPYLVLWLVFLWRLHGLLKAAALPGGLYSPATASRLRMLGWRLTLAGLAASIIESAAKIMIFTRLVDYPGLNWFEPAQISFSFTTLITGLTLITVARCYASSRHRCGFTTCTVLRPDAWPLLHLAAACSPGARRHMDGRPDAP